MQNAFKKSRAYGLAVVNNFAAKPRCARCECDAGLIVVMIELAACCYCSGGDEWHDTNATTSYEVIGLDLDASPACLCPCLCR